MLDNSKASLGKCFCVASLTVLILLVCYVKRTDLLAFDLVENSVLPRSFKVRDSDCGEPREHSRMLSTEQATEAPESFMSKSDLELARDFINQKCYASDILERFGTSWMLHPVWKARRTLYTYIIVYIADIIWDIPSLLYHSNLGFFDVLKIFKMGSPKYAIVVIIDRKHETISILLRLFDFTWF